MTRQDLEPGYQAVQSSHALIKFVLKHREQSEEWDEISGYLWQAACKDEDKLQKLMEKAEQRGIRVIPFYEPDIDNQLTAIALEPTWEAWRLIRNLPKMLKPGMQEETVREAA